jgi:hypothetical protein
MAARQATKAHNQQVRCKLCSVVVSDHLVAL